MARVKVKDYCLMIAARDLMDIRPLYSHTILFIKQILLVQFVTSIVLFRLPLTQRSGWIHVAQRPSSQTGPL